MAADGVVLDPCAAPGDFEIEFKFSLGAGVNPDIALRTVPACFNDIELGMHNIAANRVAANSGIDFARRVSRSPQDLGFDWCDAVIAGAQLDPRSSDATARYLAAVFKLAGNSLFFALSGAAADVFAIGAGNGVDHATMLQLFEHFVPSPALVAKRVATSPTGPVNFELTMARKDARLMLEAAGSVPTMLLPSIAQAMDRAIARGDGPRDYAIFASR